MRLRVPDADALGRAFSVRLGGYWLYSDEWNEWNRYYHETRRAWDGREAHLRYLRDPDWSMRGHTRSLRPVAAPMLAFRGRAGPKFVQLVDRREEWFLGGRFNPYHTIGYGGEYTHTITTSSLKAMCSFGVRALVRRCLKRRPTEDFPDDRLRISVAPSNYRLPEPLARWILGSPRRIAVAGWDIETLVSWTVRRSRKRIVA